MWYKAVRRDEDILREIVELNDENYEKYFYCAIKPAIYVAKFFGLFPIDISSTQPQEVNFRWRSLRAFISSLFVICCITTTLFNIKNQLEQGPLTPSNVIGIIFFGFCAGICILFFGIAKKWRNLMIRWTFYENDFMGVKYEKSSGSWSLKKKIWTFLTISCSMAAVEHLLSIADHLIKHSFIINFCNLTIDNPVEFFITKYQAFVVNNLPFKYNNFVGVLIIYLNVSYTFYWNFLDIFTILISIGLSDFFERLNHRMESLKSLQLDEITWSELRVAHVKLCELISAVNDTLGVTFLVSCCNNGYFILIQMLNVTNSLPFFISKFYYWFSFLFLIARTSAAILFGARVYESARWPLKIIRSVKSEHWCEELQRFFDQTKMESNALSGKNFFIIQRSILLSMAGALITYELVLLQFDEGDNGVHWEQTIDCEGFK